MCSYTLTKMHKFCFCISSVFCHTISDELMLIFLADTPSMQQLKRMTRQNNSVVKVVEVVAYSWRDLAYALGFDFPTVKAIENDTRDKCMAACEEVFGRWIGGQAQNCSLPVNWIVLMDKLRDCDFTTLANDLDKALL